MWRAPLRCWAAITGIIYVNKSISAEVPAPMGGCKRQRLELSFPCSGREGRQVGNKGCSCLPHKLTPRSTDSLSPRGAAVFNLQLHEMLQPLAPMLITPSCSFLPKALQTKGETFKAPFSAAVLPHLPFLPGSGRNLFVVFVFHRKFRLSFPLLGTSVIPSPTHPFCHPSKTFPPHLSAS